jgi:pseudaminic acid synthase
MRGFSIAGRPIGPGHPPYVIAEMSANHGGDLERAKRIVRLAAQTGADSVKLQAYSADSITIDCDRPDFRIEGESLWTGRRLYDLYREAATPYEWFPELFAYAREQGITPFASAFAPDAVSVLESVDCPAYKIASFEAVDHALIAACARTGKPLIISTGMCDADETGEAIAVAKREGASAVAILKCTSSYPALPADANLTTIPAMAARYQIPVGVSDHTPGTAVAVAACALGACIVEKHFIDALEPPTADSAFSLTPDEFTRLVREVKIAHASRGLEHYGPVEHEKRSLQFRRSLYVVKDVTKGSVFTRDNVRSIRPGMGLAPKHLDSVIGRKALHDIVAGTALSWNLIV